jgi:hypothetical protein
MRQRREYFGVCHFKDGPQIELKLVERRYLWEVSNYASQALNAASWPAQLNRIRVEMR